MNAEFFKQNWSSAKLNAGQALRLLSFEVQGIQAAAYVLAACALLSSLLALVRDRMLAQTFGASTTLDIYYAGFRLPDLIFVATGALVSVYMLIPELAKRSEAEQKDYIDTIIVGFSVFAVAVSAAAAVIAPYLLAYLYPNIILAGHGGDLVMITRIILLQPILLGLSNILAAITQARHRYALYSISPLLYNLGIILGIGLLYPMWGIVGLAWGVVLGAGLHLLIQVPSIYADGFLARWPRLRDPRALLHTAAVSVPRSMALSMNQVAFLVLSALAGSLTAGSIAVFMFAFNLQAVPLAIIGASYSVAAFPTLAAALSRGERAQFIEHVATAARYVFFWSLPASALILVLRAHIVRVILGSGAFDWTDTRLTAAAFALLALSLAAQGVTLLLVRGYYAAGRTFMPFLIALGVAFGTVLFSVLGLSVFSDTALLHSMEVFLRVENISGSRVLVLAAAYSLATIIGAIALVIHFESRYRGLVALVTRPFLESCAAASVAAVGTYVFLELASSFYVSSTAVTIFVQGCAAGVFGLLMTALAYRLLGSREYAETYASLHARLWKTKPAKDEVTLVQSAEQ